MLPSVSGGGERAVICLTTGQVPHAPDHNIQMSPPQRSPKGSMSSPHQRAPRILIVSSMVYLTPGFLGIRCFFFLHIRGAAAQLRLTLVTPWTVATRLLCPWDSPRRNTGVGCHSLLQGIFPIKGLNPSSLALAGKDSSTLSHWGSPYKRQMISIYYYFAGLLKKKKTGAHALAVF